ncbi:MAG: alpha-2-macroglobulin [Woeseia sp.]
MLVVFVATAAAFAWYQTRPQPPAIVAIPTAPGVAAIVGEQLEPQPLVIDFSVRPGDSGTAGMTDSVARLDLLDAEMTDGIHLSPSIPGTWRWESDNRLRFTPDAEWPAGTRYTVRFGETLFAPGVRLADSSAEFETPPFTVTVDNIRFYQDPRDDAIRQVVATLAFSHAVDADSLARHSHLDMRPDGSTIDTDAVALDISIDLAPHGRQAFLRSGTISLPDVESFATLRIDTKVQPARGHGALQQPVYADTRIPDVSSYFRVDNAQALIVRDDEDNPAQTVTIAFTDRVNSDAFQQGLEVWLLPEQHTVNGRQMRSWNTPREVTDDVLQQAVPVDVHLNPTEHDAAALQSFRLDTEAGRYIYVRIADGLMSTGGFVMADGYDTVLHVPDYPQEARIARDGAVLPVSGDHRLTFVARGVASLKVDVGRLLDQQISHLATQTGGDISSPYFTNYRFNEDNITDRSTRYLSLSSRHPKEAVYASLDLGEFLDRGGFYFIDVQGWDPEQQQPLGGADRRFIMITDLGLIVKSNADQSQDVFVQSIADGSPVTGARVELLGKNGIAVRSALTDARGHALLPTANGLEREQAPAVFLVSLGPDRVFLPYQRYTRQLRLERYDVGGDYESPAADRLKAYLFTDRGLYRPGDTVNIAAVVKREDFAAVGGVPLELVINDARGATVHNRRLTLPASGFVDWPFATDTTSATGGYTASLFVVRTPDQRRRMLGSTDFRVEEFQPDRLRIRARIAGEQADGWLRPGDIEARVTLENLFGTPATNRRVAASWQLVPTTFSASGFSDFVFGDPYRDRDVAGQTANGTLPDAVTGDDGEVTLSLPLAQYDQGIYRLSVSVEGFEAGGGRGVQAVTGAVLSPLEFLVGHKTDGNPDFIQRNAERHVDFVAVNSDGKAAALDGLRVQVAERRYVSSLVQQDDGTYAYQSVEKEVPVTDEPFAIGDDGTRFRLPTSEPGRYIASIADANGLLLSRIRFAVAGGRNMAGNLERNAELDLKLNGTDFSPDEEIEFEITAPYAGAGLVTLERDRVYAFKWIHPDTTASVHRISVPAGLEGNGYLNVAFVRDIDSPEVFVSPLSYAVAPFSISRDARTTRVTLDMPDRVRPGDELLIDYSASRESKMVIYGVDEGILQVARYARPDPLGHFLGKKALQVATFQIVDLILPAWELLRSMAAAGGGEAADQLGKNLNPFRRRSDAPVVFWSGIVDAGPDARQYRYGVPDYFDGTLRVMAVAVSDAALGTAEQTTLVRGPMVLTPNALTAAAPDDEFEVSTGIANNAEGSGPDAQITVDIEPSGPVEIVGESRQQLVVAEGREGRASFRVRALGEPGDAVLRFVASTGAEQVSRTASLSVRPAVPYQTTVQTGQGSASPLRVALERQLLPQFASQHAAASASPLVLADGLTDYLEHFPHQCVEQMVSRVFPQLGLLAAPGFGPDRAQFREAFDDLVVALRRRQHADGGFRFWPNSGDSSLLPSVYAMHFLVDAGQSGLPVPADMLQSGLEYLRNVAGMDVGDMPSARNRAYAIYLLTRNGHVTTSYLTNLHETLERTQTDAWRSDLAAAYMAASYALLQQAALGAELIGRYEFGAGTVHDSDFDTRLGRDAQYLYLVARHFATRLPDIAPKAVDALAGAIFENRFNTLSSAYTVLALGAYTEAAAASGQLPELTLAGVAADGPVTLTEAASRVAQAVVPTAMTAVDISGANGQQIFFSASQAGYDAKLPDAAVRNGIEIARDYVDGNGKPVNGATIGDELTVRLRVRSLGGYRSNVAIVDLLPGGFEVIAESVRNEQSGWSMDYRDVREDRVVVYGGFGDNVTEIRYQVKVTSAGDFVVPSAYASAMYDRSVHARTVPSRFTVTAP